MCNGVIIVIFFFFLGIFGMEKGKEKWGLIDRILVVGDKELIL